MTSLALLDKASTPRSFVMIRDITMRKLALDALSDSENLFRTLSEKSMAGIYVFQEGYADSSIPTPPPMPVMRPPR